MDYFFKKMKFNYENAGYLKMLDKIDISHYGKYLSDIFKYSKKDDDILEVGCGNGSVINELSKIGYKNIFGCDISRLFIDECLKKKINAKLYNGKELPYKDKSFNLVSSYTVFEHVDNPQFFLCEKIRVLKDGGIFILACPNFLSVLYDNPRPNMTGFVNRLNNFIKIFNIYFFDKNDKFEKMNPINRKNFKPDDDAIVRTNLVQLERFIKKKGLTIIYSSGFMTKHDNFIEKIGTGYLRFFLPSCYIIAKK